jgi:Tol biopolymer transport system component
VGDSLEVYLLNRLKLFTRYSALLLFAATTCFQLFSQETGSAKNSSSLLTPGEEKHLRNIRQLTFGGQNAEAYFSADDRMLSFQHQGEGVPCDQIYTMPVDTPDGKPATPKLISSGKGRTTCSYIFPSGDRMLYSSTQAASPECPPKPDYSHGYVWPIYSSYKIYTSKLDGSDVRLLTNAPGYNAESTISRDGKKIVFTSTRNGDLDIYTMNADGSDVKQLTHELGYDGGPFWSADGKKIVYRAQHPQTPQEIAEYKALYAQGLIRPGNLEIWVMNADGSNKHQVTRSWQRRYALRSFIPMAGASSSPRTWPIRPADAPSTSTSLTKTQPGWSGSRTIRTLTRSLCSPRMASGWYGLRTATAKCRTRRIFSLRIGCSRKTPLFAIRFLL